MPSFKRLGDTEAGTVARVAPLSNDNIVGEWDFQTDGKLKIHEQKLSRETIHNNTFDYFKKAMQHSSQDEIRCGFIMGWKDVSSSKPRDLEYSFGSILSYFERSKQYDMIVWRDNNEFYDNGPLLAALRKESVLANVPNFWRVHSGTPKVQVVDPVAIYNILCVNNDIY